MEIFGFGKDKALALMHSDSFPSFRIGKEYYVEERRLRQWMMKLEGKQFTL